MTARSGTPIADWWWGTNASPLGEALRVPLLPFAALFSAGTAVRNLSFTRGWRHTARLPLPVISVGNITVGGTGKTPTVRWLAEQLLAAGRTPIVVGRGYGARAGAAGLDEEGEALLRAVPGVVVRQGEPWRSGGGDWAALAPPARGVVILDDGFQRRQLQRDLDIVLVDASRPFGCGWPLPAGPLREPASALARADVAIITRCDVADAASVAGLRDWLSRRHPELPVLRQRHVARALIRSGAAAASLAGRRVWLLSAIGHPAAFAALVTAGGATVLGHDIHGDHAALNAGHLAAAWARGQAAGAGLVLTTTKDAPKLEGPGAAAVPWDALDVTVAFDDDPAVLHTRVSALAAGGAT